MTRTLSTPRGEVNIRTAVPGDATQLFDLRLEGLQKHPEAFSADLDETVQAGVPAWEERILEYDQEQTGTIMLAWYGETLTGMTGIYRRNSPKIRHFGSIWGVYVRPEWRGMHIAEGLINGCIEWAMAHGVCVVDLGVNTLNTSAIRCYTRCGFTIAGTYPKIVYHHGVYYDEYMMVRLL